MAEIKAHEFSSFLNGRARNYFLYLVYGPDRGLVSERAADLAKTTGVALEDPFSSMRLDASDISSNPSRLFDEAYSTGLFGGQKLLWLKGAGADKTLSEAVVALCQRPPDQAWIIIEAGDLKKGANLRKAVEGASSGMAIPCYADDSKALNALIDEELSAFRMRIDLDARETLRESLGGDRIASRGEIRKLALYARGEETITLQHVLAIIGDASALSADDAVDAILKGDREDFLRSTQKVVASKTSVFVILQACLKQFQLLDVMRAEMDERRISASDAVNQLGRHLHFRRKPVVETALKSWSAAAIATEMNRLQSAILMTRRRASLEDTIALQTLLATTLMSAKGQRNATQR